MVDFVIAIPARYSSMRLPGKPLRLLAGTPLIVHVVARAQAAGARDVWVATDDQRIAEVLAGTGVNVAQTRSDLASGTDRLAECADIAGWSDDTIVVNVQGDEPFVPVSGIRDVAHLVATDNAEMATLAEPITEFSDLFNPNIVKLVKNAFGKALYFSRAPIPWHRGAFDAGHQPSTEGGRTLPSSGEWWRHIGLYAYRAGFLRRFAGMRHSGLETVESLEQLRVLEAGHSIAVAVATERFPPGIDTEEDLNRAEAYIQRGMK